MTTHVFTFDDSYKLNLLQFNYLVRFNELAPTARRYFDKTLIENDPAIRILGLPATSEFYFASHVNLNIWKPDIHRLYTDKFDSIVVTLLCIQKHYFAEIDKNVFLAIIRLLAEDPIYVNFDLEENNCVVGEFEQREEPVCTSHSLTVDLTPYTQPSSKVNIFFAVESKLYYKSCVISNNSSNNSKMFGKIAPYDLFITAETIYIEEWSQFIQNTFLIPWGCKYYITVDR